MSDFITSVSIEATNDTSAAFEGAAVGAETYGQRVAAAESVASAATESHGLVFQRVRSGQEEVEAAWIEALEENAERTRAAEEKKAAATEAAAARIEAQQERIIEGYKLVGEAALGAIQGGGAASLLRGFGEAAGVAIAGELLEHVVDKTKEAAIEFGHLSAATGIETETLVEFTDAMKAAGAPAEGINQAFTRMARGMQEARDPTSRQAEAFRALGVSTAGWADKLPEASGVLDALAAHLQNSTNRTQDLANMSELFGRNVIGLTAFLRGEGEELQSTMAQFKQHAEALKAAREPAEQLHRAETQLGITWDTWTAKSLPAVSTAIGYFNIGMLEAKDVALQMFDEGRAGFEVIAIEATAAGQAIHLAMTGKFKEAGEVMTTAAAQSEAKWNAALASIDSRAAETLKREWDILNPKPEKEASGEGNTDYENNKKSNLQREAQVAELSAAQKHALDMVAIDKKRIEDELALGQISADREAELLEANAARELAIKRSFIDQKLAILANDPDSIVKVAELQGQRVEAEDKAAQEIQEIRFKATEAKQKAAEKESELELTMERKLQDELEKEVERGAKALEKLDEEVARAKAKAEEQQTRASEIAAQSQISHAQRMGEIKVEEINHEASIFEITERKKIALLEDEARAQYNAQMAAAGTKYQQAEKTGNPADVAKAQAEIQKIADEYAKTMDKLKQDAGDAFFAPFKAGFDKISGAWDTMLTNMIVNHENFHKAFSKMLQTIEGDAINSFLREGEKFAEKELRKLAMHILINHEQVAADGEKSVASEAVGAPARVAEAMGNAAVAASGAAASQAGIPIIGPELATAAAAAMYAEVSGYAALASAAGGWDLPSFSGGAPAILHAREMVLPAHLADSVRRMAGEDGGGGGGGNRDSHDVHYHGVRGESPDTVTSNMRALRRAVKDGRLRP